jgi:hypothetical protein
LSAAGNLDRRISEEDAKAAGKAVAAFMKALGDRPREVTTYALSVLIAFMANNDPAAQRQIIRELHDLAQPIKRLDAKPRANAPPTSK